MFSSNHFHLINRLFRHTQGRMVAYWAIFILLLIVGYNNADQATAQPKAAVPQMAVGPTLSSIFRPNSIAPSEVSTLEIVIESGEAIPHSGSAITVTLPTDLVLATPVNESTNCNGKLSALDGGAVFKFTNGRLGAFESCSIYVDVTSNIAGSYSLVPPSFQSDLGTFSNTPNVGSLTVNASAPSFSMAFSPAKVLPNTVSRLTYTIDNTLISSNTGRLSFSHTLPDGLEIAAPANVFTDCKGPFYPTFNTDPTVTAESGTAFINFYNSTVPSSTSCNVGVDVIAKRPKIYHTVTSEFTYSIFSSGKASGTLDASKQTLLKAFIDDPVRPSGTTTVQYTIHNDNRFHPLTNITFTDDFSSALAGLTAVGLPQSDVCGSGSTLNGSGILSLTSGSL
ncbi:MAG: hypothetical protein AAF412_11785, partial [Pseudomonadota bacterium]